MWTNKIERRYNIFVENFINIEKTVFANNKE